MLRIAFVGPTRVGKSSAINALSGHCLADIGFGNMTKTIAEYNPIKLNNVDCTLIDTPASCQFIDNADVVLYLVDVNNGGVDDVEWAKFRDHYAALNKLRTVPIQIAILITKCDTSPTMPTTNAPPPNILIAESLAESLAENLIDQAMLKVIDGISKKYSDTCPIIPFNAHGRAALHPDSSPALVKSVGRRAITDGFIEFDVKRFYDIKTTSADFFILRTIMNMTDTLSEDIKKYSSCGRCDILGKCECAKVGIDSGELDSDDVCDSLCYSHCGEKYNMAKYNSKIKLKANEHYLVNYLAPTKTANVLKTVEICLKCFKTEDYEIKNKRNCTPQLKSLISLYSCAHGYRACTFNIAHPCGRIANKLMELYKTSPSKVKDAIIQFAFNGQSQFGKSPNYNAKLWNLMATHLTFDNASHFDIKMVRTKDEAFRLLQFGRNLPIPDKIDMYCAALRLPAESAGSLNIECVNGETGIFADMPIYNISDLKLVFDLIPTKRRGATMDQLFADLGEKRNYGPAILAQMAAIVARINTSDYDKEGLFK